MSYGGTFALAHPLVEAGGGELVNDPVADVETVATAAWNAAIDKPLKLVCYGLRPNADVDSDVSDAELSRAGQGVQQSKIFT